METIEEVWVDIKDAEGYSVSSFGEIRNNQTGSLIKPQISPQGVLYVPLYVNGEKITRAVKPLVAKTFVSGRTKIFDTAINKDGNKRNNRIDNLVWRPRWFAVKYSRQFLKEFEYSDLGPVHEKKAGDIFETIYVASVINGVLFRDVFTSCRTGCVVFPTSQIFFIP